jgi:hypothetical protein
VLKKLFGFFFGTLKERQPRGRQHRAFTIGISPHKPLSFVHLSFILRSSFVFKAGKKPAKIQFRSGRSRPGRGISLVKRCAKCRIFAGAETTGIGPETIKPGGRVAQVFIQAPGMGCFLYL